MERISNEADAKPKHRKFPQAPNKTYVDELIEFILKTGQPEGHTDLHHGPISSDEPFTILSKIEIPRSHRPDGDLAPCPMCNQPKKFLDGRIVYLEELQAVAVIGHDCANKEISRDAERRYQVAQALTQADDYFLATLPMLKEWEVSAATMLIVAAEAEEFSRQFRGKGRDFHQAIRSGVATDGRLHVTEVIESLQGGPSGMRTSTSSAQTQDIYFGQLTGRTVLHTAYRPERDIQTACRVVKMYLKPTENEAFEYVAELSDEQRVKGRKDLIAAAKRLRTIHSQLMDFQSFFRRENVELINAWASHPAAPKKFTFEVQELADGAYRIKLDARGDHFRSDHSADLLMDLRNLAFRDAE